MNYSVFSFTREQFEQIKRARMACGSLSVAFDTIAFAVFLYLVAYHRVRSNRPSLRLAAFCCLANCLENMLYIMMIKVEGPSSFCTALQYISDYMIILGVCFLTLIGINLVLVYVVNFRHRQILEWIYYPYALIYSAIGLIGPIIQDHITEQTTADNTDNTCWYIGSVKGRFMQTLNFMWVYGFVFFSTVVALVCSIVAITKLVKDSRLIPNLFKHRHRVVSSQFPKVIVRCLLYPLVPLVTNFLGFLMQCIVYKPGMYPGYTLTMANSILRSLGGFLVALIFLTDPVITEIFAGWYNHWRSKHVEEYVMVEKKENNYIRVVDDEAGDTDPIVLVSFPPTQKKSTLRMVCLQSLSILCYCCSESISKHLKYPWNRNNSEDDKDDNNKDNLVMGTDLPELTHTLSNSAKSDPPPDVKVIIPMRRLKIPNETVKRCLENRLFIPDILVRRSFKNHIMVEESVNGYFVVVDEKNATISYLFIYYSSVRYAKFIHFLFTNPVGRAFYRDSNAVVDVTISAEPLQENQYHHRHPSSSDPTAEL